MKCKYCGKWVGLFKTSHEECEKVFEQKQVEIKKERARSLAFIKSTITAILDGNDEVDSINKITTVH